MVVGGLVGMRGPGSVLSFQMGLEKFKVMSAKSYCKFWIILGNKLPFI